MGLFNKDQRISKFFKSFGSNKSGAVAIMAGFAFPVMFVGIGGALDYTNAVTTTQKAQRAMDSTVLALTRRDLGTIDIQAEGEKLFNAILDKNNMRTTPKDMQFALNDNVVSGSAQVESKMYFLSFIGMNEISGGVSSAAIPPVSRPIEIALVLDVSGSMSKNLNGSPRIDQLKTAVNAMFDKLEDTLPGNAQVSASLVPYSTSVNLGDFPQALKATSVGDQPKPDFGADVWAAERSVAPNGSGGWLVSDAGPGTDPVPFVTATEIGNKSPNARLAALTDNIGDVRTAVAGMTPAGWTAGHIGMAWGVYSLSDSWSSVWPQNPQPHGDADKIIVVLSDGLFNTTHNIGNTSLDKDPETIDNPAGQRSYKNNNQAESDAYFQNVCDMAKTKGITIYAVALALDPVSEGKMQTCVGAGGKLYKANSANGLSQAFEDIARRLGSHRLTS